MKYTFLSLIAILCLASCNDSTDTFKCYQSVLKEAGEGAAIKQLPGRSYVWIAKKTDGTVWLYTTGYNSTPEVSKTEQIF